MGFLLGLIGVGAGLILLPMMINRKYVALEASFTISFINFLLSASGFLFIMLQLVLGWYDILFLFLVSFIGCLILTSVFTWINR